MNVQEILEALSSSDIVQTFPHHLHICDEAFVVESAEAFIDDVLNSITEIINSGKIE